MDTKQKQQQEKKEDKRKKRKIIAEKHGKQGNNLKLQVQTKKYKH